MSQTKSRIGRVGTIGACLAIALGGAGIAGCGDDDNEGAAEEAGQAVDDASGEVENAAEDAGDEVQETGDDVDQEVGDEDEGGGKSD
ncbi:MAG TPA: hypothetical protein VFY99_01610 [Solirubrobacterales bacterium]